jgi:KDO2-lipid IV(A) lauroyltransferase
MRSKIILLLVWVSARMPLSVAHWLGVALGSLFYWIPNRERHVATVNLAICFPDMKPQQRQRLLRRSLIEGAKTLLELPSIWVNEPTRWMERVDGQDGEELLRQQLAQGRGVIVAIPHLGNWELHAHYLAAIAPFTALCRPPRQAVLDDIIKSGRSRSGATLVPTSVQGVKSLYSALRAGEIVAILPDQQPKGRDKSAGVFAPFFGRSALTMVLINRLARKTGAAVLFSFGERLSGGGGFRLHWYPAPEGIDDADPEVAATALNLGVEQCVRLCPEQYQWSYKRFEATPDEGRSPYSRQHSIPTSGE